MSNHIPNARTTRELAAIVQGMPPQIPHPKVAKAADALRDLVKRLNDAERDASTREDARGQAVIADRAAYADAIRANKPDPGTPNTNAADQALTDARRHRDALHVAADHAATEFHAIVNAERDKLVDDAVERADRAEQHFATLIDTAGLAANEMAEMRGAVHWARNWPTPSARYRPVDPVVPGLVQPSGEPHRVIALLDALAAVQPERV